jgi:hypothetical protein
LNEILKYKSIPSEWWQCECMIIYVVEMKMLASKFKKQLQWPRIEVNLQKSETKFHCHFSLR